MRCAASHSCHTRAQGVSACAMPDPLITWAILNVYGAVRRAVNTPYWPVYATSGVSEE